MHVISPAVILMIEPSAAVSPEPVIDVLTRKMTAAWRARRGEFAFYRGYHTCACGAESDNDDHRVGKADLLTNSLCVHYLAFHRAEVPQTELDKVAALEDGEAEPTNEELCAPKQSSGPRNFAR